MTRLPPPAPLRLPRNLAERIEWGLFPERWERRFGLGSSGVLEPYIHPRLRHQAVRRIGPIPTLPERPPNPIFEPPTHASPEDGDDDGPDDLFFI